MAAEVKNPCMECDVETSNELFGIPCCPPCEAALRAHAKELAEVKPGATDPRSLELLEERRRLVGQLDNMPIWNGREWEER